MTGIERLNRLSPADCADALRRCCGSDGWVAQMIAARPFETRESLGHAADRIWRSLGRADWLQAFAAHPRIGERTARGWSAAEQEGALDAGADILEHLGDAQRAYESRFGHLFIVCATGKRADEMLALVEARMANDPEAELLIAADEQLKITRLRLDRLLGEIEAARET